MMSATATTSSSPVVYEGAALPPAVELAAVEVSGDFPAVAKDVWGKENKIDRDAWTTSVLITTLWKEKVPAFSLLWLSEPDFSQHATGPGSPQSLAAIKSSDNNLGRVLAELDKRGLRASTDVMVVSDHGFSTIQRNVDVAVELSKGGFDSTRVALGGLKERQVMVASNGGSVLLYVGRHDAEVSHRLVNFLQNQDWTGVIFSRQKEEGTFALTEANINPPEAPDLVVSLRWNDSKSGNGTRGMYVVDGFERAPGQGNHATLGPSDTHNTLVAAGPDFKPGVTDSLPTGNVDVAPTVLHLLGLKDEAAKMDGRVLTEALAVDGPPLKSLELKHLTAKHETSEGIWEQYLQISEVNGVRYQDQGNGELKKK